MPTLTQASICEITLALASLWGAVRALRSGSLTATAGFGLLAAAALAGALEYGGLPQWSEFHEKVTRSVTWLTFILLIVDATRLTRTLLVLAVVGLIAAPTSAANYLVNVAALAILGYRSGQKGRSVAITVGCGIGLFVLAALGIGSSGELAGLPRRDLYHLSLAGATLLLMQYFRPGEPATRAVAPPNTQP